MSTALSLGDITLTRPRPALLPATVWCSILVTAFASSSTHGLRSVAAPLRWVVLGLLAAGAAAAWVRTPRRPGSWQVGWAAFVALALVSSTWSVDPRLSLERAATLVLLFVAIVVGASVLAADVGRAETVATAIAGAVVTVCAASLAALVDWHVAVQPGWTTGEGGSAARFRGITEDPNTIASFGPIALPLLLWLVGRSAGRRRLLWLLGVLLLAGETVASLSRIPVVLMMLEALVYLGLSSGRRRVAAGAAALVAAIVVAIAAAAIVSRDFGHRVVRETTVRTLSGRTVAWHASVQLIGDRPAGGYGFGTEEQVFVAYKQAHPRPFEQASFTSTYVHDSYLGAALQVGIVGAALVTLLLLAPVVRVLRRATGLPPRLALAIALSIGAAAVLGIFSSYFYSVGNVITVAVWTLAALTYSVGGSLSARTSGPKR